MKTDAAMMEVLENTADTSAMLTGMKKQLLDQGWSEAGAEEIVIHCLKVAHA